MLNSDVSMVLYPHDFFKNQLVTQGLTHANESQRLSTAFSLGLLPLEYPVGSLWIFTLGHNVLSSFVDLTKIA